MSQMTALFSVNSESIAAFPPSLIALRKQLLEEFNLRESLPLQDDSTDFSVAELKKMPTVPFSKASLQAVTQDPKYPVSKYNNVRALLLHWEDDDRSVSLETHTLAAVLRAFDGYNFFTKIWQIPNRSEKGLDPKERLKYQLRDFCKDAKESDLLILYYGGYARATSQGYIWTANQRDGSESLNWLDVQDLLLDSVADVLLIFGCCEGKLAATPYSKGNKWLLGLSQKESSAPAGASLSFTNVLAKELKRCAYRYWRRGWTLSEQSLESYFSTWENDYNIIFKLTRLTSNKSDPIDFTPLPHLSYRPKYQSIAAGQVQPTPNPQWIPIFTPPTILVRQQLAYAAPSRKNAEALNQDIETITETLGKKLKTITNSEVRFPKRPVEKERVFAALKRYDTRFVIDDSDSMAGSNWTTIKQILGKIAAIVVKYDPDGVDVRFFNAKVEEDECSNLTSVDQINTLFRNVFPFGATPTADRLEFELNEYCYNFGQNRRTRGLNLIILTDGEPSPGQDVEAVIKEYAERLAKLEAAPLQVGIQFVQIGGNEEAAAFLKTLDDDLKKKYDLDRDMVDTVAWVEGDEEYLHEKILLGGILKKYDDDENSSSVPRG